MLSLLSEAGLGKNCEAACGHWDGCGQTGGVLKGWKSRKARQLLSLTRASGVLVLLFLLARSKSPSEKGHRALNAAKVIL